MYLFQLGQLQESNSVLPSMLT